MGHVNITTSFAPVQAMWAFCLSPVWKFSHGALGFYPPFASGQTSISALSFPSLGVAGLLSNLPTFLLKLTQDLLSSYPP